MARDKEREQIVSDLENERFYERLESLILRGETSPQRLGAAFQIAPQRMYLYVKEIQKRWKERRIEELDEIRDLRIEQIAMIMRLALKEYDESRKPTTEYTEEIRRCGFCKGQGKDEVAPDEYITCKYCGGTGEQKVRKTVIKERTANPVYLKLAKECVETAATMGGVGQKMNFHAMNRLGATAGGEVNESVEMLSFTGTEDQIINAIAAMDAIRNGMRTGDVKKVNPSLIIKPKEHE